MRESTADLIALKRVSPDCSGMFFFTRRRRSKSAAVLSFHFISTISLPLGMVHSRLL